MEFKGFNDWIEIFRGGKQVDSQGRTYNGDDLIKSAAEKYNARVHEAPLVVGHPADNAPAFGWVEGLRTTVKDGVKTLEARFKQVAPEFEALVRQGRYKKRSAAFYSDGSLRHVGFLGGLAPAVKGLADVAFRDGAEAIEFDGEFTEEFGNQGGLLMELKEFFEALKSWTGLTSAVQGQTGQWPAQPAQPASQANPGAAGKAFSEADLNQAKAEAAALAKAEVEARFAEQQAAGEKQARELEIKDKVKALVDGGKLAPAFSEQVTQILLAADQGQEMEFAEGRTGSPADWLIHNLEQTPVGNLFSEFATAGAAGAEFAEARKDWETGADIAARVNPRETK